MPKNVFGFLHFRRRKHYVHRTGPDHGPFAAAMDQGVYLAGFLAQVLTIPQLGKIYIEQDASGVSVITWISFVIVCLFWVVYGIAHKERSIIFMYSMLAVLDGLVAVGAVIYG